jgi:uncharacterized protein
MSPVDIALAGALGVAGGLIGGVFGVGGGVLFVPALAILIVAAAGAWRQHTYGNVRLRDGLVMGALSPIGVAIGVVVANAVSQRVLELSFAVLVLFVAAQLVRRALRSGAAQPPPAETAADP